MWQSYLIAYPNRDDFWQLTPRIYMIMMKAYRDRKDSDWNESVDMAAIAAMLTNPPKNFKIEQFYRGERNPDSLDLTEEQRAEQAGRELYCKLQNFSDRFRAKHK